jgi:predicted  nucleic acid-binding Zn-ribbon protein
MDSLRRIRAQMGGAPDTASLQRAVDDAQARLDACQQRLSDLEQKKQNLENERDNLRNKQDDLLNQLDQLFHSNGWIGGHGYHSNGRRWWGYVGDENSNTNLEPQYSKLTNEINRLNARYMQVLATLNQLPGQIAQARRDCDELKDQLKAAKEARDRGNQYEAFKVNLKELCRQIRSLLQPLLDWCTNNPQHCNFGDQLRNLMADCPDDNGAWDQFWRNFGQLINSKKAVEDQLRNEIARTRRRISELDDEIRETERQIDRLRDEERRQNEEAERRRSERQRQLDEAARRARQGRREARQRDPCKEQFRRALEARAKQVAKRDGLTGPDVKTRALGSLLSSFATAGLEGVANAANSLASGHSSAAAAANAATAAIGLAYGLWVNYVGNIILDAGRRLISRRICQIVQASTNPSDKCGYIVNKGQVIYYQRDAPSKYRPV